MLNCINVTIVTAAVMLNYTNVTIVTSTVMLRCTEDVLFKTENTKMYINKQIFNEILCLFSMMK